jgi:hypothetical protein
MEKIALTLTLLVAMGATAKEPAPKMKSKELVGGWTVQMELDFSSCAPGWGKPGDIASEKWSATVDTDGQLQIQIVGEGSGIDANNTGYTGAVEPGYLMLSNTNGHNSRIKLHGTPKLLTGTCMTAIPTSGSGGPDKGACALLYTVTAKKQN